MKKQPETWIYRVCHKVILDSGATGRPRLSTGRLVHEYEFNAGMSKASLRRAIINEFRENRGINLHDMLDIGISTVWIEPTIPGRYRVVNNENGGYITRTSDREIYFLHGLLVWNEKNGFVFVPKKEETPKGQETLESYFL